MCLTDRLKASIPETEYDLDELIRLDELAQTAIFTSQGIPFMLSGEEMLRDKKGCAQLIQLTRRDKSIWIGTT